MSIKGFFGKLNILAQCSHYRVSVWQCPQFLFLIMGTIIIGTILITYQIGTQYIGEPEIVALIVMGITFVLLIISFSITKSFEKLAEVSRMKSEFVSVVSHQLRSPLSNLKWAIDFLLSGRLGKVEGKQLEYFKILKENSSRMMELVGDLLIVSRIEQGSLPLRKKEISLEDITSEVIRGFDPFARASNVEIRFKSEKNLPKIFTDPSQIRLVIENLLDNAIRYIKDRGEVEIRLQKNNNNLYFEVKDSGVGIPKEEQKYISQKFFRSENIMKYQTMGSGLGLFIARSIVEKSGGKMGFASQEGKGSTFWFTLKVK